MESPLAIFLVGQLDDSDFLFKFTSGKAFVFQNHEHLPFHFPDFLLEKNPNMLPTGHFSVSIFVL